MYLKTTLLLTILFIQFGGNLLAKGSGGSYYIQIYLHDASTNKRLKNVKVVINGDTFISNNLGKVSFKQHWETACGFWKSKAEISKINDSLNPGFIGISYLGKVKYIKNKWRKYGLRANYKKRTPTYKVKIRI